MIAGTDADKLRTALMKYSKEELAELAEYIIRLYVLDEPVKLYNKLSKPETLKEMSDLSFEQLLRLLQSGLDLEELSRFRVSYDSVYVRIGDNEFDLFGPSPIASSRAEEREEDDGRGDDEEEERRVPVSGLLNRPWRTSAAPKAPKKSASSVETASMSELFADDGRRDRASIFSFDPPEAPPPIAEHAPGDEVDEPLAPEKSFAQTARDREEEAPKPVPELAEGDRQIDPSNRYGSLDFD